MSTLDIDENQLDGDGSAPRPEPRLDIQSVPGGLRAIASGPWTVENFTQLHAAIGKLALPRKGAKGPQAVRIELDRLSALDTAGAWLLNLLRRNLVAGGAQTLVHGGSEAHIGLLNVVETNTSAARPPKRRAAAMPLIADTVSAISTGFADSVRLTGFLGEVTVAAVRTAARPWRFRWTSFIHHIEHTGLRAVPIISLICLLIGAVITQQGILQLQQFGAEPMAVDMVGILALREVGILLTAIMVAGRSASAFTAEIGTMKAREEIDAMRTLGIDPVETLVLPRIAALIVTLPILAFIGDIMCLAGGALMAYTLLDIPLPSYIGRLHDAISVRHFLVGIVKAPLAAMIIGLVGCLQGLSVQGSAESLGSHVTQAVVKAIFLVIIFDALFAMFLSASGY